VKRKRTEGGQCVEIKRWQPDLSMTRTAVESKKHTCKYISGLFKRGATCVAHTGNRVVG
jgi:hypothetical protein